MALCLVEYQKVLLCKTIKLLAKHFVVEHNRAQIFFRNLRRVFFVLLYNQGVLVTNYTFNLYEQYHVLSGPVNVVLNCRRFVSNVAAVVWEITQRF